jgi:ribosomal protein S18 acetylase RimI-like enzyme
VAGDVSATLEKIESSGRTALAEMRRMLGVLRADDGDAALAPQPGLGDIATLIESVRRTGLDVALDTSGDLAGVPPAVALSAYRIVQDPLTNTMRHAEATRAEVPFQAPSSSDRWARQRALFAGDDARRTGRLRRVKPLTFRAAGASDVPAVAALHADSWRRHYRGSYADAFLDGDILSDRLVVWGERLQRPATDCSTVLAELEGHLVGFVHTVLDADPVWGALLDNLHVAVGHQGMGIGTRLMGHSAMFVVAQRPQMPLFLWVHQKNTTAQRFYQGLGGQSVESAPIPDVAGVPGRLKGAPLKVRYTWPDAGPLVPLADGRARAR